MLTLEARAVRRVGVPTLALTLCLAGTAAAQVGLRAGDRITALGGRPVETFEDMVRFVKIRAGERVRIDYERGGSATTIIAEQACPGVQVRAGQLTTLRLAARVNAGQEAMLEEKLRTRATQVRQQLAADGRDTWCAQALAAFGPEGSVAKGILATGAPIR